MKKYLRGPFADVDVTFSPGVDLGHLIYADATALDPGSLQRVAGTDDIADEVKECLDRLSITLAEAGVGLGDIVKVNCYVTDEDDLGEVWGAIDAALPDGPIRISQVTRLAGTARVLLDVTAAR